MKKILSLLLIIFLICGCGKNIEKKSANKPVTINIAVSKLDLSLDPTKSKSKTSKFIIAQLFDGLTYLNSNSGKIAPLLSSSYKHTDDYKSWIFELRNDIKFSNGEKILADNCKKSLERTNLDKIIGSKIEYTIKDNNLIMKFQHPVYKLDEILANPEFVIVYNNDFDKNIITSGAYCINSLSEKNISLLKNKNYWDSINTRVDTIGINLVKDPELAYQTITQNINNILSSDLYNIPKYKLSKIKSLPNILTFDSADIVYMTFNNKLNENLRKALCTSLERSTLSNLELTGAEKIHSSIFNKNKINDYDVDIAKTAFSKSGYNEKSSKQLNLIVRDSALNQKISKLIIINWYKLFQIHVNAKIVDTKTFDTAIKNNNYDISLDVYEPYDISGFNFLEYVNAKYFGDEIEKSNSLDSYTKILENHEKSWIDNYKYTTLFNNRTLFVISDDIKYISSNKYGICYIKDIEMKDN